MAECGAAQQSWSRLPAQYKGTNKRVDWDRCEVVNKTVYVIPRQIGVAKPSRAYDALVPSRAPYLLGFPLVYRAALPSEMVVDLGLEECQSQYEEQRGGLAWARETPFEYGEFNEGPIKLAHRALCESLMPITERVGQRQSEERERQAARPLSPEITNQLQIPADDGGTCFYLVPAVGNKPPGAETVFVPNAPRYSSYWPFRDVNRSCHREFRLMSQPNYPNDPRGGEGFARSTPFREDEYSAHTCLQGMHDELVRANPALYDDVPDYAWGQLPPPVQFNPGAVGQSRPILGRGAVQPGVYQPQGAARPLLGRGAVQPQPQGTARPLLGRGAVQPQPQGTARPSRPLLGRRC